MKNCDCRGRHACRVCRRLTKPVSTCPMGPLSRNGMLKWLRALLIGRLKRSHGSTTMTPQQRLKPGTLGYQPTFDWSESPLWAKSGHMQCKTACPLLPPKADIFTDLSPREFQ